MFRRGSNFVQDVLGRPKWIDAFKVGTVVSPVMMTDDHYFTGEVVEVQPKINKVFVSWDGGSEPTQHDPDELEPIYPCTSPSGVSHSKTASVRRFADKKPENKAVFIIDVYDNTIEEGIDILPETGRNYYDQGEAIKDAKELLDSYADDEHEIIVSVWAGEYENPEGDIFGELFEIWFDSNKKGKKTASIRTAGMSDYDYQCATAIRNAIIEEHRAVAIYEEMAHFAQDDNFKQITQSIADEEKAHIGELTDLLDRYNGNEVENMNEGISESAEMLAPDEAVVLDEDVLQPVADSEPFADQIPEGPADILNDEVLFGDSTAEPVPEDVEIVGEEVKNDLPVIPLLATAKQRRAIIASGSYGNTAFPDLVRCIRESWDKIPPKANIFLEIMEGMAMPTDRTGQYEGIDVIESFIENAAGWNTSTGKAIKKELSRRIKDVESESKDYVLDADKKKESK